MAQHQRIVAASNSLGNSENWSITTQQLQKDSLSSSEARTFSNRLDNSVRSNWQRTFDDKSSFAHTMEEATRTQFQAAVGGGFRKIISGNGQITVVGQDNEKVSFNVSEDTSKAFARDQARVHSEAIQQTFNDTQGLDYLTNMAKKIGATEAYSYLNDSRRINSSTESYGADLTTALIRNYATERYGSESPESIRRTISDFNHFLTQQGSQGVENMKDIISGFVSGKGYGWGNTSAEVNNTINSKSNLPHADKSNISMVERAATTASAKTSGISNGSFSMPKSDIRIEEPDGRNVLSDSTTLRNYNRNEENSISSSRIKTTPTDMMKEGVGNIFQGQGLVDSQTEKATNEGFFNKPSRTVIESNIHVPGPIPKNAPSTLENKNKVKQRPINRHHD
jgi:conjugal transfer mating pair stabilization protein TraG